jgi:hypothetical protein
MEDELAKDAANHFLLHELTDHPPGLDKEALVGQGIGAGIGALMAPKDNRVEGAQRGGAIGGGVEPGLVVGGLGGAGVGGGSALAIYALIQALQGKQPDMDKSVHMLSGGATLGGIGGALAGGYRGGKYMQEQMGPPSWTADDNEKQALGSPLEAGLGMAQMLGEGALTGGLAGAARGKSDVAHTNKPVDPHPIIHGVDEGMGGVGGANLGSAGGLIGGGLLGGGLGAGAAVLLTKLLKADPVAARRIIEDMGMGGAMTGGGLGAVKGWQWGLGKGRQFGQHMYDQSMAAEGKAKAKAQTA